MEETIAEREAQATLAELAEWLERHIKWNQAQVARHDANLGKVGSLGASIYDPVGRNMSYGCVVAYQRVLEKIQGVEDY